MFFTMSISHYLTQIVNFPTRILDCDLLNLALLHLVMASAIVLRGILIILLWRFPLTSLLAQTRWSFSLYSLGLSHVDWDGFFDHIRDIPWGNLFLGVSAAASKYRNIDVPVEASFISMVLNCLCCCYCLLKSILSFVPKE